jgi:hypothetical protein
MKLINLLKEAKAVKEGASKNPRVNKFLETLRNAPGTFVMNELSKFVDDGMLSKEIEKIYSKADKSAAKLIEDHITDMEQAQVEEKLTKLETIKKKASDIQDSLTLETKKRKKKKK